MRKRVAATRAASTLAYAKEEVAALLGVEVRLGVQPEAPQGVAKEAQLAPAEAARAALVAMREERVAPLERVGPAEAREPQESAATGVLRPTRPRPTAMARRATRRSILLRTFRAPTLRTFRPMLFPTRRSILLRTFRVAILGATKRTPINRRRATP